jgi:hypothetical protein
MSRWKPWSVVTGAVLFLGGCGSGNVSMAPVTGRVTMDGQPVRNVFVVFHPLPKEGGVVAPTRPAMGQVDDDGRYELSTKVKGDGAAVGNHRVSIVAVDRNARPPGNVKPDHQVEVRSEPNVIDLELIPSN